MPALGDRMKSLPDGIPAAGNLKQHYLQQSPPARPLYGRGAESPRRAIMGALPARLATVLADGKISVYQEDRHVALANNCGNR